MKQVWEWDRRTGTPSTLDARRDHPANNPHQLRSCVKSVRNCPDQAILMCDARRQANYILPPMERKRLLSYITLFSLHFSHSVFLSSHHHHPFLTTWWSIYCQAICSVMLVTPPSSQKGKKKNLRHDMMTYPGGMIHCSLGLMGEGSQPSVCVFVCLCVSASRIW